jgi:hypothetical protein
MNWAIGVITAPRPLPTRERTLASLAQAGFVEPLVCEDSQRRGSWPNWLQAVRGLLQGQPHADVLLLCEDDVIFCRGLRAYLQRSLWPEERVALCSPYCPAAYRAEFVGWHRERRGACLVGSQCWAMPRHAAAALLADLGNAASGRHIDARVGHWAAQTGRSVWYHTPSLGQHLGEENSALGNNQVSDLRHAVDFIGEDVWP